MFFCTTIAPIIGRDGSPLGLYQTITNTTAFNTAQRRLTVLLALSQATVICDHRTGYWQRSLDMAEPLKEDVPFALFYSVAASSSVMSDKTEGGQSLPLGDKKWHLEASIGITKGSPQFGSSFGGATDIVTPILEEALKESSTRDSSLFRTSDRTLPEALVELVEGTRGFGDKIEAAVAYCVRATNNDTIYGVLIIGLNPRLPYDEDYQTFIKLLGTQFTAKMAVIVLDVERQTRTLFEKELVASEKARLQDEILQRRQETVAAELKLERISGEEIATLKRRIGLT